MMHGILSLCRRVTFVTCQWEIKIFIVFCGSPWILRLLRQCLPWWRLLVLLDLGLGIRFSNLGI
ncbi:hypothetical protein TIFTF001_045200 [Ficus carica]|uniref:Uncharacterized protein n=1 Tax=Ficus carica TaxID=3494 RepID=A0AA88CH84_FICCA|nr:hypothetical protein TIFTF001_045200 [Ficus carica]